MCERNRSVGVVSFTLGALLGAGVGVLLSTKKGRRAAKNAWKYLRPYEVFGSTVEKVKDSIPLKLKKPLKKAFFKGL